MLESTEKMLNEMSQFATDYKKVANLGKLLKNEGVKEICYVPIEDRDIPLASFALLLVVSGCNVNDLPSSLQALAGYIEPHVGRHGGYFLKTGLLLEIGEGGIRKLPKPHEITNANVYWVVPKPISLTTSLSVIWSASTICTGEQYFCLTDPLTEDCEFLCLAGKQVGEVVPVKLLKY
jgi:hypothetical protein